MHAFSHKAVKDYEKITLRKRQLSCGMGVPVFAHFSFQRGRKRFDRINLEDFLLLGGGGASWTMSGRSSFASCHISDLR